MKTIARLVLAFALAIHAGAAFSQAAAEPAASGASKLLVDQPKAAQEKNGRELGVVLAMLYRMQGPLAFATEEVQCWGRLKADASMEDAASCGIIMAVNGVLEVAAAEKARRPIPKAFTAQERRAKLILELNRLGIHGRDLERVMESIRITSTSAIMTMAAMGI
jgi:hypothetical protein